MRAELLNLRKSKLLLGVLLNGTFGICVNGRMLLVFH